MHIFYLAVVIFLIALAVCNLAVGVSNDAVNFLNSAIGAKVARRRTIVIVAAVGVFLGASLSNGMMDVARNGIMTPAYFSFYDVMCVFLAVMMTNVVLLDMFNSRGMPTSTTVSMVFALLGGSFSIALHQIIRGATTPDGTLLSIGDLVNTEKAISVILGIFCSVGIAFVIGAIVQWIARLVFTFTYDKRERNGEEHTQWDVCASIKIGIFGGLSTTIIVWFLLINGLKGSSFMNAEMMEWIHQHSLHILVGGMALFSTIMTLFSLLRFSVLKSIVLLGTFALAMAFAGNDLVNFVGVPLTGLEAYLDYSAQNTGESREYMMTHLMGSAQTPVSYLVAAGVVMVLSLFYSKKAQNVVKTSVDLSRQEQGDEMFGSSEVARTLVRSSTKISGTIASMMPKKAKQWIESRFNSDAGKLPDGAAFDEIRAAVNLVMAGALVALGTSFKLPLSTTYVTFMVAMGASLADGAWSRESAVFRITGMLSVIGGWFFTAGAAFIASFGITLMMDLGGFWVMGFCIALTIFAFVHSWKKGQPIAEQSDTDNLFQRMMQCQDKGEMWELLKEHVEVTTRSCVTQVSKCYEELTTAFFCEDYRMLKQITAKIEEMHKVIKRQRRKQIVGLRNIDPIVSVEKGTWYFLTNSTLSEMVYCLKRMGDPCRDHVSNNFCPVEADLANEFLSYQKEVQRLVARAVTMDADELIREDILKMQGVLSTYHKRIIHDIETKQINLEAMTVLLNMVQETQLMLGSLRQLMKGMMNLDISLAQRASL